MMLRRASVFVSIDPFAFDALCRLVLAAFAGGFVSCLLSLFFFRGILRGDRAKATVSASVTSSPPAPSSICRKTSACCV
ncbi:MAG TPA: hypothetical protein VGL13_04935, partial [Polyangiaceae bacterium]